jgi:hypothetical protein
MTRTRSPEKSGSSSFTYPFLYVPATAIIHIQNYTAKNKTCFNWFCEIVFNRIAAQISIYRIFVVEKYNIYGGTLFSGTF